MPRLHYLTIYRGRDPYVVLHPSSSATIHKAAEKQSIHAVGRKRVGKKTFVYMAENAPLLFSLLNTDGIWVCGDCKKASFDTGSDGTGGSTCSEVVWDDEWIQSIGMSRFETIPEWERVFESIADAVGGSFRINPAVPELPIEEHERVLGLVPPYDRDMITKAFRAAAMRTHPDRNPGQPKAAEEFNRVTMARDALMAAV